MKGVLMAVLPFTLHHIHTKDEEYGRCLTLVVYSVSLVTALDLLYQSQETLCHSNSI